jgi:hypothetical protein
MFSHEPQVSLSETVERRRDERVNQPDSVKVCLEHTGDDAEFQAVLVNVSCSGLAIRHWRKELPVGQRVRIGLLAKGEIVARVMWNWAVGPVVISGLEREQSGPAVGFGPRSSIEHENPTKKMAFPMWMLPALLGVLIAVGWYLTN